MNKLEKPKFFTTPIWANISVVLSIIVCFSFYKYITDYVFIIIIIGLMLLFISHNLIKYIFSWHKFYKSYLDFFKKFNELDNRYKTRISEIKNKDVLIEEYEKFTKYLNLFIISSLTKNSSTETEQLKNMQSFLYLSIEHINKQKGVDIDGRHL